METKATDVKKIPKKIMCYKSDRSGCWLERIHIPFAELAKRHQDTYHISVSGMMQSTDLDKFDLAIFQRQYYTEVFKNMMIMKRYGTKVVYEIDDDVFSVPEWNPAHTTYGKQAVKDNVKAFLGAVDACFVTSEDLKSVYQEYCPKVYVLPNSIDFTLFRPVESREPNPVVLWQGSNTHEKDVMIVKKALHKLSKRGDCFIKLWSFDVGLKQNWQNIPFVHLEDFYTVLTLMNASIGLAPLHPNKFNKGKSNLKVLEYWAQRIAVVASNFGPYADTVTHEENGLLVSSVDEWYDAIVYLLENPDVRDKLINNGYNKCREEYDIKNNYVLWKNAIDEILEV